MRAGGLISLALSLVLCAGAAAALEYSVLPVARPGSGSPLPAAEFKTAPKAVSRHSPVFRPGSSAVAVVAQAPVQSRRGFASPLPVPRPARLSPQTSRPAYSQPAVAPVNASAREAALCGVRDIRGQKLGRIPGQIAGCGVTEPVQVTELAGVRLSSPAVIDCTTAKTLRNWVEKDAKSVIGRLGGGLAELQVAASYACRPRNNQPGAKISEHGKGRAIDISALRLANGMVLSVQSGWKDPVQGKLLRRLHSSACGPFGTVLGPESDRFHKDHFHFDTARYRSGSYCR